jgi:hypothetical protein
MSMQMFAGLDSTTILAYLDPGLGSMQLQIIVAGLLSVGFFLKTSLVQAKHKIGQIWKKND